VGAHAIYMFAIRLPLEDVLISTKSVEKLRGNVLFYVTLEFLMILY
jgi:hypothetical protein